MAEIISSGRIADIIIALMLLEGLALYVFNRMSGRGIPFPEIAGNFMAGICLLLAMRAGLSGAAWWWPALWLGLALAGHLADLWARWRN